MVRQNIISVFNVYKWSKDTGHQEKTWSTAQFTRNPIFKHGLGYAGSHVLLGNSCSKYVLNRSDPEPMANGH